jgi:acetyl esterase/lipase
MAVRVYRPTTQGTGTWPAVLFFMGGAYNECKLDERDFFAGNLAR